MTLRSKEPDNGLLFYFIVLFAVTIFISCCHLPTIVLLIFYFTLHFAILILSFQFCIKWVEWNDCIVGALRCTYFCRCAMFTVQISRKA